MHYIHHSICHFKYFRAAHVLSSIACRTIYNQHMAETFDKLVGFRQIAGDIVIYDKDVEGHMAHVRQFLQRF